MALRNILSLQRMTGIRYLSLTSLTNVSSKVVDLPDNPEIEIPPYIERTNETMKVKKSRLLYQSRKRGMLENGLLLSTFAAKYLEGMNDVQVREYDRLINKPSNDWDIYYWAINVKPTPPEHDNEIMNMFKEHVKNINREQRFYLPDL